MLLITCFMVEFYVFSLAPPPLQRKKKNGAHHPLQNDALPAFHRLWGLERCQDRLVEHVLQALLRQRRTLDVLDRLQFLRQLLPLLHRYRLLFVLRQLLNRRAVVAEVHLRPHQQKRRLLTVVSYFRYPLQKNNFNKKNYFLCTIIITSNSSLCYCSIYVRSFYHEKKKLIRAGHD